MSMSDPIADMLTRIRNAQMVGHTEVAMPASRLKASIAKVLKDEGYIEDFALRDNGVKKELRIGLKYYAGRPVIERLERVSKPGLRVYRGRDDIPRVMNGLGVAILSTSRGVMTDRKARADGVGGEVLCIVA
ncbi:MAG: 30S ribosomal protein S8 [Betaproteobacteria bacterium RIFCSPLOWO2_12_FULL_68_19]|nr:30S ribosomal protein S8 [Betaproteobacteria bacterium]OGA41205.1 MAG: 30S ribosomal protein S8 [Betaproteobacteria bacterium RIFCSPLOWO2_12_FULL_68_19]